MCANALAAELAQGALAELVLTERGEERRVAGELRQLDRGDGAAARGLLPGLGRVHDLAGARQLGHARELDPLDVPDDDDAHDGSLTAQRPRALELVMDAM